MSGEYPFRTSALTINFNVASSEDDINGLYALALVSVHSGIIDYNDIQ